MKKIKQTFALLLVLIVVIGALALVVMNYSYVFAKTVSGEVTEIERLQQVSVIAGNATAEQLFSFSIAIREPSGEIYTASSTDRQLAIVRKGNCVVAKFFKYPPWNLEKGGTYFNARLDKIYDCPGEHH